MMAYSHEDLTIWAIASLTKYFKTQEFGLPVSFKQQAPEQDDPNANNIQIMLEGPDFSRAGTKNERYGVVHVRVFINTQYVPTDIYFHTRLKAKVISSMQQEIPLQRIGAESYDKMLVGVLRPIPSQSVTVTAVSVEEPDGSLVEGTFCIELC